MKLAISVARPNLVSLGTCFGKFSKSGKFKLHITCLDYLAQYAKFKVSCILSSGLEVLAADRYQRFGSNQTAKCHSCTGTTSLKRTWDE